MNHEFKYLIPMAVMTGIALDLLSFKAEAGDCTVIQPPIDEPIIVRIMI